jgi:hypothetical protein
MSLESNVKAAKEAEEVFALIGEGQPDRFFSRLAELCNGKVLKPLQKNYATGKGPMNESEAIKFEAEVMEWGQFKGREIGRIDPEYLVWLIEGNTFIDKLKRYVNSHRFKQRMNET